MRLSCGESHAVDFGEALLILSQVVDLEDPPFKQFLEPIFNLLVMVELVDQKVLDPAFRAIEQGKAHLNDALIGRGDLEADDKTRFVVGFLMLARSLHQSVLVQTVEDLNPINLGCLVAPASVGVMADFFGRGCVLV